MLPTAILKIIKFEQESSPCIHSLVDTPASWGQQSVTIIKLIAYKANKCTSFTIDNALMLQLALISKPSSDIPLRKCNS